MKTIGIILISLFLISGFSQSREELRKQLREERRQMMRKMIQMFNDDFSNDPFFDDDSDPFGGSHFSTRGRNVEISEKLQDNGDIHINIKPTKKNIQLDIQTTEEAITIKSELKVEEESKDEGGSRFKSFSSSSFSQTIGIPRGYKVKSSTPGKEGILIILSADSKMRKIVQPKKSKKYMPKKVPLGPRQGEDYI